MQEPERDLWHLRLDILIMILLPRKLKMAGSGGECDVFTYYPRFLLGASESEVILREGAP